MERIAIRFVLGCGVTAIGALLVWAQRATADVVVFLAVGSAMLAVAGWMWLEWERDRLLRWSKERRVAAVARVIRRENQPAPSTAVDGPCPPLSARKVETLPAPGGR